MALAPANAQKLQLVAEPATATLHLVLANGSHQLIGTGRAEYKLKKKNTNSIVVKADGYAEKKWDFVRGQKYPDSITLALDTRVIDVKASNETAEIYVNDIRVGVGNAEVSIASDQSAIVEAKLDGYWPARKEYSTGAGSDSLPLTDILDITDRMVVITARPAGATVSVDGAALGENFAEVRIPNNSCVTVSVAAEGFVGSEEVFCNQERMDPPPESAMVTLSDRQVMVRTLPQTASILVDGRTVGTDEYSVVVQQDKCVEVTIEQSGFVSQSREYCNRSGGPALTDLEVIELNEDEAFTGSQASDQANNNITIEVGETRSFDDAWKIMSLIVLSSFDILEITDKETGYLRTAWAVSRFESSTIRTRIIVKQGDIDPVKFVVKIVSEFSPDRDVSTGCDLCFRPWDRLLYQYQDIINEMIFRLR